MSNISKGSNTESTVDEKVIKLEIDCLQPDDNTEQPKKQEHMELPKKQKVKKKCIPC